MKQFIELSAMGQGPIRIRRDAIVAVLPHDDNFGETTTYVYVQGREQPFQVSEQPDRVMALVAEAD